MRLDDYRTSDNVSEQQPGSGGGGFGGGGLGGGGLGLILSLVGSRFGIVGIIIVIGGAMLLGMNPFGGGTAQRPRAAQGNASAAQICNASPERKMSCQTLASTEDTWGKLFQAQGATYRPATLDFYSQSGTSGCGAAQSAMGPFYCPTDNTVYLDTDFFRELTQRFGAAGDFAQRYVIAHEVGHHVQTLEGISDKVRAAQSRASEAEGNRWQVAMELQADCFAGVWGAQNRALMEPGDVDEGLRAAQAIGDDTLQKAAGGRVVPESFTHGTSAQRVEWLKKGLTSGDPAQCDTFGALGLS